MGRIPEETIEQILAATDIVDVISGYFPVKRAGSTFKALCPFHNERTPSFNINPARQSFHCFGCGESGGAIGFVMKYENLPFLDAVKKLADKAGVPIIEEAYNPKEAQEKKSKSRLVQLHNDAAKFMHQLVRQAPAAQHARDYLKSRGFNSEMAERWLIGWMPEDGRHFLSWAKEQGYTGRELCNAGIAAQRDENNPRAGLYLRFRDRLMFPIHNDYGDIIAFSGRQLRDDPRSGKYINSPETMIFNKSKVFFGLDKARRHMTKEKFALLCEGQIDAISCYEHGIKNAIAPLGTAFTEHHARLLKRYTNQVILCFDADGAGYKAMEKAFAILVPAGIHVRCVDMPEGEDPDSLIRSRGVDAFRQLLADAREFFDFKLSLETRTRDLTNIQQKSELVENLAALAQLVKDKIAQDTIIGQVAARLSISEQDFRSMMVTEKRKASRQRHYRDPREEAEANVPVTPTALDSTISYLCYLALSSTDAQQWLCEQLETLHEPIQNSPGGHILGSILARKPDASSPAAVQTYILTLAEPDQLALMRTLTMQLPENPVQAAEDSTSMLLATHLQRREAAIRTAMKQHGLPHSELIALMEEAKEISQLLKGLPQRFVR